MADLSQIEMDGPPAPAVTAQLRRLCSDLILLEMKLSTFDPSSGVPDHDVAPYKRGGTRARDDAKSPSADLPLDEVDVLKKALEAERVARLMAEERAALAEARMAEFRQWGAAINALRLELGGQQGSSRA